MIVDMLHTENHTHQGKDVAVYIEPNIFFYSSSTSVAARHSPTFQDITTEAQK